MTLFKVNRNKTKQHSEHSEQHAGHHDQGRMPLWTSTTGSSATDGVAWNDSSSLMQSMFRSVSMTEPPTTTPTVRFSTSSSCGGQISKTTFPLHPAKVPTFHKAQSSPPDVRSPVPPVWKVLRLHTVPIYYPMEKSAIKFSGSLAKLTNQISDFLKHHSITSVYHDEAGRVDCMTSGLLHFSVQLWKGDDEQRSENSVDGPNVIVEIQRRQGCCIEMQRLRQDLILWLQHPREETTTNPMTSITVPTASPRIMSIHVLQQLVEQSTLSDGTKPALTMVDCENAFRIACRLLNSSRLDERRLGLESLHVMTNARNVMTYLADYVSSKILTDPDIQSFLLDYFVSVEVNSDDNNNNNDDDSISGHNHDGTLNYIRGRFFGEMHILALKVLANALDTMVCQHLDNNPRDNGFSFNDGVKLNLSTPLWNHALQAMLYNMHISHVRPLEACLSVRSLRRLHSLCPEALKQRLAFF